MVTRTITKVFRNGVITLVFIAASATPAYAFAGIDFSFAGGQVATVMQSLQNLARTVNSSITALFTSDAPTPVAPAPHPTITSTPRPSPTTTPLVMPITGSGSVTSTYVSVPVASPVYYSSPATSANTAELSNSLANLQQQINNLRLNQQGQIDVVYQRVGTSISDIANRDVTLQSISAQSATFSGSISGSSASFTGGITGGTTLSLASTTPWGQFSLNPNALGSGIPEFVIGSSTATHFVVNGAGNVGIGTTTPGQKLSVAGDVLGNNFIGSYFTATSTSATSTLAGGLNVAGSSGMYVQSGSGNVSVGSSAFDQLESKLRVRTRTSDSTTGGLTVQDPLQRYTFIQYGNGRINTYNYDDTLSSVFAMYNHRTPVNGMGIGHFAYGSYDDLSQDNTNAVHYAYMDNIAHGSLESHLNDCWMHAVNDMPGGVYAYQQPNECLNTGHFGLLLPAIPLSSSDANLNLDNVAWTASSTGPGPVGVINGRFGVGTSTPLERLSVGDTCSSGDCTKQENNLMLQSYNTGAGQGSRAIFGMKVGGGAAYSKVAEIDVRQFSTPEGISSVNSLNFKVGPWANTYAVSSAGTPKMTILSNGNIGIASTTPYATLSIAGIAAGTQNLFAISTTTAALATSTAVIVNSVGFLGVGTSTPAESLATAGRLYVSGVGTSTIDNNLYVRGTLRANLSYVGDLIFSNNFRFVEAPATSTVQALNLRSQTGAPLWSVDENANVGIGTETPLYKLHVMGDVAATSFVNISTRDAKRDISYFNSDEERSALNTIRSMNIARYHYTTEDSSNPLRIGLIAEEAPSEVLSVGGKGVDIYKLSTFILAGVKAQGALIDALTARVASIETLLGTSTLTHAQTGIVDTFTVGSAAKPVGITLYDEVTGLPYCLSIANGNQRVASGECVAKPPVAAMPLIQQTAAVVSAPVVSTTSTSTPEDSSSPIAPAASSTPSVPDSDIPTVTPVSSPDSSPVAAQSPSEPTPPPADIPAAESSTVNP